METGQKRNEGEKMGDIPSFPALIDYHRLNFVHLMVDKPHRSDSNEGGDANDGVVDNLRLCVDHTLVGLLEDHAKVDSDELLRKGEYSRDGEDNNAHAAGRENGGGNWDSSN